jgi:hypothetical protein
MNDKNDVFSSDESDVNILSSLSPSKKTTTVRAALFAVRNSTIIIRTQEKEIERLKKQNKELKNSIIQITINQLKQNNVSVNILSTILDAED